MILKPNGQIGVRSLAVVKWERSILVEMVKKFSVAVYRVHTSSDQPQNAVFCPPSPPILGVTISQSPPKLGDLGG